MGDNHKVSMLGDKMCLGGVVLVVIPMSVCGGNLLHRTTNRKRRNRLAACDRAMMGDLTTVCFFDKGHFIE